MGIGVKYDDGSGSMRPLADYKKPLASYRGMSSPWGSNGHSLFGTPSAKSMNGPALRRKSMTERLQERRDAAKKAGDAKDVKLDEIDPRKNGKIIGEAAAPHPADADKDSRGANGHDPWGRACMTGLHFEREAPTGRIIVWGYLRTDRFTGEGRCFETTGEEKVPVFSFFEGEADGPVSWQLKYEDGKRWVYDPVVQIGGASLVAQGCTSEEWNEIDATYEPVHVYVFKNQYGNWSCKIGNPAPDNYAYDFVAGMFYSDEDLVTQVEQYIYGRPVLSDIANPDEKSIEVHYDTSETQLYKFSNPTWQVPSTDLATELVKTSGKINAHVLVRMLGGAYPTLNYIPLGTLIGGGTEGVDETVDIATGKQLCDESTGFYLQSEYYTVKFEKGLAKTITGPHWTTGIKTTPLSEEL